jgi:hypothetical protein
LYNVELVREVCAQVANAEDSRRVEELLDLLYAVLKDDQDEIRIRRAFLAKKFASANSDAKAAEPSVPGAAKAAD